MSAITDAVKVGDTEAVKRLLAQDPSLAGARDESGETPLMAALYRGHRQIVDLLIDVGCAAGCFCGRSDRSRSGAGTRARSIPSPDQRVCVRRLDAVAPRRVLRPFCISRTAPRCGRRPQCGVQELAAEHSVARSGGRKSFRGGPAADPPRRRRESGRCRPAHRASHCR